MTTVLEPADNLIQACKACAQAILFFREGGLNDLRNRALPVCFVQMRLKYFEDPSQDPLFFRLGQEILKLLWAETGNELQLSREPCAFGRRAILRRQ